MGVMGVTFEATEAGVGCLDVGVDVGVDVRPKAFSLSCQA